MKNKQFTQIGILILLTACQPNNSGWQESNRVYKTIDNITYIFPNDVEQNERDKTIQYASRVLKENLNLIEEKAYTDTIKFEFVHNREEMKFASGYSVKGLAMPYTKEMFSILDLGPKSAIKHELMHMILIGNWGNQYRDMQWFNEGLATYAGTLCGETNFNELYYYLLTKNLLIPIDKLTNHFYENDEVIAYSQSAFIVKSLSENYGWSKLKELWQNGFTSFESIIGISYQQFENKIHAKLAEEFSEGVNLDWDTIKLGCP